MLHYRVATRVALPHRRRLRSIKSGGQFNVILRRRSVIPVFFSAHLGCLHMHGRLWSSSHPRTLLAWIIALALFGGPPSLTVGRPLASNGTGPIQGMRSPAPPGGFRTPQTPATPNGAAPSPADRKAAEEQQHYFQQQGQASAQAQTVSSTNPKVAAQAAADNKNIVRRKLTGYVGFANLPNQWHRKSVRKGFNFNVMVVGECRKGTNGRRCKRRDR